MKKKEKVTAIIVAAGSSRRMGKLGDKLSAEIAGMPVIAHTLAAFEKAEVDEVILVTGEDRIPYMWDVIREFDFGRVKTVVAGGDTRSASVRAGIAAGSGEIILIHDGARCLITPEEINAVTEGVRKNGAAAIGVRATDTLKRERNGVIAGTVPREDIWQIQTPQGFQRDIIERAHSSGSEATDDCALAEELGIKVLLVEGSRLNMKITVPEDLQLAEWILHGRSEK